MAKQTKFIMVVSISKVQVNHNINIRYNHAILSAPHDNLNPLSIQTHSKVHYL